MFWDRWNLGRKTTFLMTILMVDGILLGMGIAMFRYQGIDKHLLQKHQTVPMAVVHPGAEEKVVALTFDDGPHETYTLQLLDGLQKRGVKVTFFLMGQNISGNEALVRRMQQEGHLIGNHSYRHIPLTKAAEDMVCEAVEHTEQIIENITGNRPKYLRPPYGDWNENLECRLNLTTVFWSVDSLDWKLQNKARIVNLVENKVRNGDIILMHDIFPESVEAALEIIDQLTAEGYQFVTVDELLID
jgi:peptidoglycan/xylan/chitin deacetylase (PgdA/CDA1 family)